MTGPIGRGLTPARLGLRDVVRVGSAGLRTRPMRVFLSALGIAIGIASMVAVLGISTSSRAEVDAALDRLGTNLLRAGPGQTLFGDDAQVPKDAVGMAARLPGVLRVTATGDVSNAPVYRTDRIPAEQTKAISTKAARLELLDTVGARLASGTWLNEATSAYPAVVLGHRAAQRLGISAAGPDVLVYLGGEWFAVVGILEPVELAGELDTAALVGWQVAQDRLGFDGHPTTLYERSTDATVEQIAQLLPAAINPEHPSEVEVSRPSDALAARNAVDQTLTALLLGLGGVALLVGGVGVANTMVISVLERRSEIGLRRALGATRGQVRGQFLAESLLLSGLGAVAGAVLGALVTAAYATSRGWITVVPPIALAGGVAATLVIGTLAGLYPAVRAARLDPTTALATT
ncbi:MAG: ABC transporter permease [Sporichthyaceae bacterium]|nr:ABC transporter permease [Sporichthyaceae bacterium]